MKDTPMQILEFLNIEGPDYVELEEIGARLNIAPPALNNVLSIAEVEGFVEAVYSQSSPYIYSVVKITKKGLLKLEKAPSNHAEEI